MERKGDDDAKRRTEAARATPQLCRGETPIDNRRNPIHPLTHAVSCCLAQAAAFANSRRMDSTCPHNGLASSYNFAPSAANAALPA